MDAQSALKQYKKEMTNNEVDDSDPHRLIQMLMEGALKNIVMAKNYCEKPTMRTQEIADKGSKISSAISIIDCLQGSLDHDKGGAIAQNLDSLYDYMKMRLVEANLKNSVEILDEVNKLLLDIKVAWDAIRDQALRMNQTQTDKTAVQQSTD